MPRTTAVLRRARKAIEELDLFKALKSEINYEFSSTRYKDEKIGSFGEFVLDWDHPKFQDVMLRKKCSTGEEISVSALLGRCIYEGDERLPREALMKICVKKPALSSILLFDCVASKNIGLNDVKFDIHRLNYLPSTEFLDVSSYTHPVFSDLDLNLQDELRRYLETRGIESNFTSSLLLHLHKREQEQYVAWLQKLKVTVFEHHE